MKQSEYEKQNYKNQIETYRESLDEALKENTVLNETLKIKENIKETTQKATDKNKEINGEQNETEEIIINNEYLGGKIKCDECEFETCVKKYLVGHKIKHHRGQYMCPSCKSVFKTVTDLDIHIKSKHEKQRTVQQYKCEKCEQKFGEMYKMRQHSRN